MKTEAQDRNTVSDGQSVAPKGFGSQAVRDFTNVTWRMTAPTVIGIAIGILADRTFQSSPYGFLAGAVIGFGLGVWMAIRMLSTVRSER